MMTCRRIILQGRLCFTVKCLYRPMFVFSSRGVLPGVVVFYSLMPLSPDVRLQYSLSFVRVSCVLLLDAFIDRCSSSVFAGFSQG